MLTPVAKAFSTDIGTEVASLGVQVHGGMGYIEETGAAQHYRDARIAQIYEGTNGIQAIDLVTRKVPLNGGATVKAYLDELRESVAKVRAANDPAFGMTAKRLDDAIASLDRATQWILDSLRKIRMPRSPARRLICGCSRMPPAAACWRRKRSRPRAAAMARAMRRDRIALARFFAETIAVQSPSMEISITESADAVTGAALPGAA